MSQKCIEFKSHKAKSSKARSYDGKQIGSSQYSRIKRSIADQLRQEIYILIQKQDKARAETRKSVKEHQFYKNNGEVYENEAEFHWLSYRTWSSEVHRLGYEIRVKLKAVQKYEQFKQIKEPKMIIDNKDYLKYGPSDNEEEE